VGILLSGDSNYLTENYIAHNEEGVFFGVNQPADVPLNIVLTHNSFVDNIVQFSGCLCQDYNTTEPVHLWDDGREGNYWSDYNGTDTNADGIGDTPYVIDVQNQDRYPLMQTAAAPPTVTLKIPPEILFTPIVLATIGAVAVVGYRKRKRKLKSLSVS
jgi:nitrous oxidase accessory protein NosD